MSFEKGLDLFHSGEFEQALDCFDSLIKEQNGNPELHLQRGRILSRMGKLDLALEDFELICGFEPYNTNYISDRAVVLHLLNRNEEALSEFDRAINLDPKNPYRYSSRAFFKDRTGDLVGAIADYEIAIELDPEDAVSLNNKGIVEEKLGYTAKSKKSFQKADQLIGYESQAVKPTELDKIKSDANPVLEDKKPKMDMSHYFQTLTSLFHDAKARKEFIGFIKTLIGGKSVKKT